MNRLGLLSTIAFAIAAGVYLICIYNNVHFIGSGVLVALCTVVVPLLGLTLVFKAKGALEIIGLVGNFTVILFALLIPGFSIIFGGSA